MATACKVAKLCQEKSDSESKNSCAGEDETQNEKPKTAFPPTDVTLEVEGIDIHLNKQVLMDKSPVLKAMFESDFSEKGKVRISLPGKKYGDFVNFLHTFYFPDFLAPITASGLCSPSGKVKSPHEMPKRHNMTTEWKDPCAVQEECEPHYEEPRKAFPPTDVILEVDGMDIHLNKQILMEKSPVFKAMFESDFSEKHKNRISLPGKKYTDFVNFLYTFYYPELLAPITEKNVLEVVCLADEYQIVDLKDKCESFIQENCKHACEGENYRIETDTLVDYVACAEKHNMVLALPLIIKLCSKHSTESLKQAKIDEKVSDETQRKILDIPLNYVEQELASTLDNGEQNLLQLMELAWEAQNDEKMKKCEDRLVAICTQVNKEGASKMIGTFSRETILDYIIAAEKYELKNLLSSAIALASKCNSKGLKNEFKYNKITNITKLKIDTKRLNHIERHCGMHAMSSYNLFPT